MELDLTSLKHTSYLIRLHGVNGALQTLCLIHLTHIKHACTTKLIVETALCFAVLFIVVVLQEHTIFLCIDNERWVNLTQQTILTEYLLCALLLVCV